MCGFGYQILYNTSWQTHKKRKNKNPYSTILRKEELLGETTKASSSITDETNTIVSLTFCTW